jgi:hypothetical protein
MADGWMLGRGGRRGLRLSLCGALLGSACQPAATAPAAVTPAAAPEEAAPASPSPVHAGEGAPPSGSAGAGSSAASPIAVPDTAAGKQLSWVLQILNQEAGKVGEAAIAEHFHSSFLAVVSSAGTARALEGLAQQAPIEILEVESGAGGNELRALVKAREGRLQVSIKLDPPSKQIAGLLFAPAREVSEARPKSWPDVERALVQRAPLVSVWVSRGLKCDAAEKVPSGSKLSHNPDQSLAIGSAFKLYVLGEAARQIESGELTWDTPITIREELKSLGSNGFDKAAPGTTATVRTLAEAMISRSDNTATDHLLDCLGRERVESFLARAGHHAPEQNVPFLSTRELFVLKLDLAPRELEAFLQADRAARRALLVGLRGRHPTLANAAAQTTPARIGDIEWFASARDLCRVMVALHDFSERPGLEPVGEILALNRGLPISKKAFPYVAYKGGSELGVLNTTWLARAANGDWWFVAGSLNNPDAPIADQNGAFEALLGAFDLLASDAD